MFDQFAKLRKKTHSLFSGVTDVLVTTQSDGSLRSTPFNVRIGKLKYVDSLQQKRLVKIVDSGDTQKQGIEAQLAPIMVYFNDVLIDCPFYLNTETSLGYFVLQDYQSSLISKQQFPPELQENPEQIHQQHQQNDSPTKQQQQQIVTETSVVLVSNKPPSCILEKLCLENANNKLVYVMECKKLGKQSISCRLFYYKEHTKFFVSDIDGTITKSPVIGMILSNLGQDYSHKDICEFYNMLSQRGYSIIYMSARSMSQYQKTRGYIERQEQDGFRLPEGPLVLSEQELMEALTIEVFKKQSNILKSRLLRELKTCLESRHELHSAIGDKLNDIIAYKSVDIPYEKIFLIDKKSIIKRIFENGTEESYNYKQLTENIDALFPHYK